MKNRIGNPVVGEDFLFRDRLLRNGLYLLQNGNSFLMLGIRRTGKSSYLRQVAYLLKRENPNYICIEVDCSTYQNTLDFYRGLYTAMPQSLQSRFTKFLRDARQLPRKIIDSITDFFSSVEVEGLSLNFHDKLLEYSKPFENLVSEFFAKHQSVFLFIDELPFFFQNLINGGGSAHEVRMILSMLRNWRTGGLAMGITGSLNLHQQLDNLGLSRKLLGGLNTLILPSFSREESEVMINKLLQIYPTRWWTENTTRQLLDLLPDYIPYFVQYSFYHLRTAECKTNNSVEEVFHNDIKMGLFKDFIYQFDERLREFKGEQLTQVSGILDLVARNDSISLRALQTALEKNFEYELLVRLVDMEFLLITGEQNYQFTLQMIRDWWMKKNNL